MMGLMIVDDEPHAVDSLADTIDWASMGIDQVHKAYSATEALATLKEKPVDIIITDIHMPKMNGLEMLEEVRKIWPRTKCLILSGYAEFEFAQKAIQLQTVEYLLKPVLNEEVIDKISILVKQIQSEWLEISSNEQAVRAIKDNLSLLKGNLLLELLQGRKYAQKVLERKLELLQVPIAFGDRYNMFMMRLEEGFRSFDLGSRHLLEYAVYNIVEEILGQTADVWYSKDEYDYHVFLLKWKWDEAEHGRYLTSLYLNENEYLDNLFSRIQHNVKVFLKGQVTILVGGWEMFPGRLASTYLEMLLMYRQQIGRDNSFYMKLSNFSTEKDILPISSLYEPPVLSQLLETGRWQEGELKLRSIFDQFSNAKYATRDNLIEVYFHIYNAFTYILHRNGKKISDFLGNELNHLIDGNYYRNTSQLMDLSLRMLHQLRDESLTQMKDSRKQIVHRVQRFIELNLADDVSLKTLGEQVYLHPAYLSKVYKMETGEGINQYVQRLRMEKAAHLLKQTVCRVYEIGQLIGLPNTTYFIKQFRKDYGMTPQEYRDVLRGE
jgi:two-component system response regulator YesN